MTLSQLLLTKRNDGTLLLMVGFHYAKHVMGKEYHYGAFYHRDWLRAWHGAPFRLRIGS